MEINAELKTVPIADIVITGTNYRSQFDQDALTDLSKSIARYGVMTPVLLRPGASGYELVCGERRMRASKMAGLDAIPANIRNLSDDEAFELQIIENLERKEVHPLDEAVAFKRMLDTGRYNVDEIAAKLAKTDTFVAQRLKLNDLVEDVKRDFFNNILNLSQAIMIARVQPEVQQELHDGYKDRYRTGYGTPKELAQEISKVSTPLERANFPLEVDYAGVYSCSVCPKRTGNNPVMFPDMQEEDSCMDKICFRKKSDTALLEKIESMAQEGKKFILGKDYRGEPIPEVVALAKGLDLRILKEYDDFRTYESVDSIKIDVLYVAGSRAGTVVPGWITKPSEGTGTKAEASSQAYSDLDRAKERAKRALELDQEKIHLNIIDSLKSEFDKGVELPFEMEPSFIDAITFYMAVLHYPFYYLSGDIKKLGYNIKDEYKSLPDLIYDISALTAEHRKQILAKALFRECKGTTTGKSLHGQIIRKLAADHTGIDVAAIEKAQNDKAAARILKSDARIKEMEAELAKNNVTKGKGKKAK